MSIARFLPVLISLVVSTGFWILGAVLMPEPQRGGYGTLVCGADLPDREIRERLEAQGFTGIVSESGESVLIDSFGSVERIPLDEYPARILSFDPRNDGYAEKLYSMFVRDDRRFIYIPLGFAGIEKRLDAALGDIPFSFHVAAGLPAYWFFILFFLTAFSFFFIRPLRVALRPHAAFLLPLLPALAPLALAGAAGFAMASLLAGCAAIFAGPYLEWHLTLPHRRPANAQQTLPALYRLLLPIFLIFYGIIAFFSGLHPLFIVPVSIFFIVLMVLQLRDAYREAVNGDASMWGVFFKQRTIYRFAPVPILSRRSFPFAFSWAMLPFAVVAFGLACASLAVSPPVPAAAPVLPPADVVTEADYYSHYWFQSTFSFRSLHAPGQDMGIYELTPDGLLGKTEGSGFDSALYNSAGYRSARDENSPADDVPPFHLGDLVRYLNNAESGRGRGAIHTLLAALLPLLFVFPILFRGSRTEPLLPNQAYWSTLLKRFA